MLGVHAEVTYYDKPNFWRARIPVPTNLNIGNWAALCVTEEDDLVLQYIQFGFPAGYEGPVPTSTFHNHPSAVHHSSDVAAYMSKELREGAILGLFDHPAFSPWTQTNPLLTRPKKDSYLRPCVPALFKAA